jgi:hypothetical protein
MPENEHQYPEGFTEFFTFLCEKYNVDPESVFIDYSSNSPPPLKGGELGYYDGLLSYRIRNGKSEFLITVFKIARNSLLTLGHEFAHLVDDMKHGSAGKTLGPPDELHEKQFDAWATRDLEEFKARRNYK